MLSLAAVAAFLLAGIASAAPPGPLPSPPRGAPLPPTNPGHPSPPTGPPRSSLPIRCPITLDGRIPAQFSLKDFDLDSSPFNPNFTKGANISWSQILHFPKPLSTSRFDVSEHPSAKSVEVTIDDRSVFAPGGGSPQLGFRRAGLLLGNGSDASNTGVQTYHWSVHQPVKAFSQGFGPMNLTHEYMNVWHEANSYAYNQFSFNAGIMLSQDYPANCITSKSYLALENEYKNHWKFLDRNNTIIWHTPILYEAWQNFAITVDYDANTLQVYYSTDNTPLRAITKCLPNANDGGGQFQIGMLKKPTETISVVNDGYQESGIHEGQIYGGIFIENSANGCISL